MEAGIGPIEDFESLPLSRPAPVDVVEALLKRFRLRLEEKLHATIEPSEVLLCDLLGGVTWNRSSSVFFKAGYMFRSDLYEEADAIIPDLFRTWIRSEVQDPGPSVIAGLVNYAVWRGHPSWIVEIAERAPASETLSLSAVVLAQSKDSAMAQYFLNRSTAPSPAAAECMLALTENRRLNLPYVLLPSAGPREKAARVCHLLSSGRMFRAVSFLKRLARTESWAREWLVRILLKNGRYDMAIHVLEKAPVLPTRDSWFEYVGALAMTGADLSALGDDLPGDSRNIPEQEDRLRFLKDLADTAADTSVDPGGGWDDVARDVLIRSKLRFQADSGLSGYEDTVMKEVGLSYERLDGLLRSLWGTVVASTVVSDADLISMAGGNVAARIVLALRFFQSGRANDALQVIRRSGRHPVAEHLRAEILSASDRWDEAVVVYQRLIRQEPDDPLIRRNYSRLLEKLSRWDEADAELHKAAIVERAVLNG
ncbi:MAG: tetratricopeptide repeat protein [Spirochaetia bacterium]|nr:tetratricopeptide repeat protein [Spirochaetia bacterium]